MNLLLVLFQVLFEKGLTGNGKSIYIFNLLATKDKGMASLGSVAIWSEVLDIKTQ
jgi:hypothetical protein